MVDTPDTGSESPSETPGPDSEEPTGPPDPDEVKPLSSDESTFQRDESGELLPYWMVIEVKGEYRKIKLEPTPIGEYERLEDRFEGRDDIPVEELTELLDDKVVEPDIDWHSEAKPAYYLAAMQAVMTEIFGDEAVDIAAEVEAELRDRRAEAGN